MRFGLKNAPTTFQRMMDNVLRDPQRQICLVYRDDVIIYSNSLQKHMINLKKIFQRFREFKAPCRKIRILKERVEFRGLVIARKELKPKSDKIKTIPFQKPKNQKYFSDSKVII